ncbi:MAG: ATP-binding cassette domain-containing protein [Atopobiaceae bacterium]|nr:ATP-binding cassette domain-containing protein [Atopobiaceae bacterium]MBR3313973.1 ATP-binding cassette domain-containing protein [Atopobiaceae bacterium]
MGWFDDQIEYRKKYERELLSDSFEEIARSVTGRRISGTVRNDADVTDAVSQLLKHLGIKEREVPASVSGLQDRLEYLLAPTGVMSREVVLSKGWRHDAMGAMICSLRESGTVVAVLPSHMGGYEYKDPVSGKRVRVTARVERQISNEAICFYRPLPLRELTMRDLIRYMWSCLTVRDLVSFLIAAAVITLVGLLSPKLNYILTGTVVDMGSMQLLKAVVWFMLFLAIGNVLLSIIRSLLLERIRTKLSVDVGAATMMRLLSMPASYFKQYSAGELNQYVGYMDSLCTTIVDSVFSTAVTGLFSLVYLTQISSYAPSLVVPSLIVTFLTLVVSVVSALVQMRINEEKMRYTAKESGLVYSLITGIQKIRLSGAENRAFHKWSRLYTKSASLSYNPPAIIRLSSVLTTAISLVGTAVMYYVAVRTGVTVAEYYAFNSAYGYISSAFTSITSMALSAASIKPVIKLLRPLLEARPEGTDAKETITQLTGGIGISHLTFGYDPDAKPIFEDFNLTIRPRQYVAIVGRSGCGKSTLVRLLLGFEKPLRGMISYDRKDLQRLDLRSLRRHIGVVMQDGKLFSGSIFENITISAPMLKLEDAWEAAEIAGIADDIREMPMGMNTVLQEGGGTISGGQRQRLMIARAIAPKPRVLIFDEATSALDNITQRRVSEALDAMKCTRLIIAHRLSTIKHCDRIVVIDGGRIAEDGTYEQLVEKNGIFAELVARQQLSSAR